MSDWRECSEECHVGLSLHIAKLAYSEEHLIASGKVFQDDNFFLNEKDNFYGDVASRDISQFELQNPESRREKSRRPTQSEQTRSGQRLRVGRALPAHKQLSEIHIPTAAAQ
jgi:hypothetical protein